MCLTNILNWLPTYMYVVYQQFCQQYPPCNIERNIKYYSRIPIWYFETKLTWTEITNSPETDCFRSIAIRVETCKNLLRLNCEIRDLGIRDCRINHHSESSEKYYLHFSLNLRRNINFSLDRVFSQTCRQDKWAEVSRRFSTCNEFFIFGNKYSFR